MKPEKHFEEFFVCPNCKKVIARKSAMKYVKEQRYCKNCGTKIAKAIKAAMAYIAETKN